MNFTRISHPHDGSPHFTATAATATTATTATTTTLSRTAAPTPRRHVTFAVLSKSAARAYTHQDTNAHPPRAPLCLSTKYNNVWPTGLSLYLQPPPLHTTPPPVHTSTPTHQLAS